jgi:tyrosyl-tRNA synthetase
MQVLELLEALGVFNSRSEACRWVMTGAVKINGIRVSKEDDFNHHEIFKIEVGKKIKVIQAPLIACQK